MTTDPRVDAYIARSADFAKPILAHLRAIVHEACPETEETMKWSSPAFMYRGKILCSFAAFKAHATFGFWRGKEVLGEDAGMDAMGQFGRIASLDDLPEPVALKALIQKGMAVTDGGPAPRQPKHPSRQPIAMPDDLAEALAHNAEASATYDSFPPSAQYDYLEWVTEAKRPDTRAKRVAQSIEWLAEGKRRHWKYEAC